MDSTLLRPLKAYDGEKMGELVVLVLLLILIYHYNFKLLKFLSIDNFKFLCVTDNISIN